MPKTKTKNLVDPDDLAGVAELAIELSTEGRTVATTNVTTWMSRRETNHSPEPIKTFRMGTLHSISAWKAWLNTQSVSAAPRDAA
jgi:hypothetical protein